MLSLFFSTMRQRSRTRPFPDPECAPFSGYLGEPNIRPGGCCLHCHRCEMVCPSGAIAVSEEDLSVRIDLGRCIFCGECVKQCEEHNIHFSKDFMLSTRRREDLNITSVSPLPPLKPLEAEVRTHFDHSLKIRFLSAGGCGGCRLELCATTNPVMDASRFGIEFVESPRHANVLMVTGPVPESMTQLVLETWEAVPEPKLYVALGACQISGAVFSSKSVCGCPPQITPDLYIPGCPPHPITILHGLLALIDRYQNPNPHSSISEI